MLLLALAAALSSAPQAPEEKAAPAEKKICRYDIDTGSIMPGRRVCRTAKDWSGRDKKNGADVDRFRARSLTAGKRLESGFD